MCHKLCVIRLHSNCCICIHLLHVVRLKKFTAGICRVASDANDTCPISSDLKSSVKEPGGCHVSQNMLGFANGDCCSYEKSCFR